MKKLMERLLRPAGWVKSFIWISSAILLVASLSIWGQKSILAYIAYALQLYSVTVFALAVPSLSKKLTLWLLQYPLCRSFLQNRELRAKLSLYVGTTINLAYAVMKFSSGVYYRSNWFSAVGVYYLFLGIMRFFLLRGEKVTDKEEDILHRRERKLRIYRFSGGLLLLLGLVMGGMTIQMVVQNRSFEYPGVLIYASAAYVFYCFTTSAINLALFRDLKNPVLSAAKTVSFVAAFMSLFSLQTSMMNVFGGSPNFNRMMNFVVGGIVCILTVFLSGRMMLRGNRELKMLRRKNCG